MAKAKSVWEDFSMQPVQPESSDDPVTRLLNMELTQERTARRRRGFGDASTRAPSGTPEHSFTTVIDGRSWLFIKDSTQILGKDETGTTKNFTVDGASRGSFAAFGDEFYYADENTLLRVGLDDTGTLVSTAFPSGGIPQGDKVADVDTNKPEIQVTPISFNDDPVIKGEKILNCAIRMSWYDPKRNTFGPVGPIYPVVVHAPQTANVAQQGGVLFPVRYQYAITILLPAPPTGMDHLKAAIWCSPGFEVIPIKLPRGQMTEDDFPKVGYYVDVKPPTFTPVLLQEDVNYSLSQDMTNTFFLEGIFDPNQLVSLVKDNTTLMASGRYIPHYEAPVPCRFMTIMPNGTALYFQPRTITALNADTGLPELGAGHRNIIEYSVEHPEQIARGTDINKDSFAYPAGLAGKPLGVFSDGTGPLLLTNREIYTLRWAGGPVLFPRGAHGVQADNSIHPSSIGILYTGASGPILLQSGNVISLAKKMGFTDWWSEMSADQRARAPVGFCETNNQILMFVTRDAADNKFARALVRDNDLDFNAEFALGDDSAPDRYGSLDVKHTVSWNTVKNGYSFVTWWNDTPYSYPSPGAYADAGAYTDGGSDIPSSMVELWCTKNRGIVKTIDEIVVHLGQRDGLIAIRVEAYDTPPRPGGPPLDPDSTSGGVGLEDNLPIPIRPISAHTLLVEPERDMSNPLSEFKGMQGKYFRLMVKAAGVPNTGNWWDNWFTSEPLHPVTGESLSNLNYSATGRINKAGWTLNKVSLLYNFTETGTEQDDA